MGVIFSVPVFKLGMLVSVDHFGSVSLCRFILSILLMLFVVFI